MVVTITAFFKQSWDTLGIIVVNAVLYENPSVIIVSAERLTKRSSSYTIWFQMRCWMTSCLNHDYLMLIFIHFPYLLSENPSLTIVSAETQYFSTRSWYRNIESCTLIWQNTANRIKHYTGGPFNCQSNCFFCNIQVRILLFL